jgi:hypothetical protein
MSIPLPLYTSLHAFKVSPDVFANNRLSLTLSSQSTVSPFVAQWADEVLKYSCGYLYEALTDPAFANSFEPSKTAFTYSLGNVLKEDGGFFDYLLTDVSAFTD